MRLYYVVLVAVAALLGSTNAQSATTLKVPVLDSDQVVNKRFLRTGDSASQQLVKTEGRRLVNIDLILKEAAISVKKATKWKAQFMWWKLINKKPFKLMQEYDMLKFGNQMITHPKWKKVMAYQKYYGKGPLTYP